MKKYFSLILIIVVLVAGATVYVTQNMKNVNQDIQDDEEVDSVQDSVNNNDEVNNDEIVKLDLTQEEIEYMNNLKNSGTFKVATRKIASVYSIDELGNEGGFNYKLVKSFADYFDLEMELKFVGFSDYFKINGEVPEQVKTDPDFYYTPDLINEVDVYCDIITFLPWREKMLKFINIIPIKQVIIHKQNEVYDDLLMLDGKVVAIKADTSYETRVKELEVELGISINIFYVDDTFAQLTAVADGDADLTIKDSNVAVLELFPFDNIVMGMPISDVQLQGWCVNKDNDMLAVIINKYLNYLRGTGELNQLWFDDYNITLVEYLKLIDSEIN